MIQFGACLVPLHRNIDDRGWLRYVLRFLMFWKVASKSGDRYEADPDSRNSIVKYNSTDEC